MHRFYLSTLMLVFAATVGACGGGSGAAAPPTPTSMPEVRQDPSACEALAGVTIPGASIGSLRGLASGDATVTSATWVEATPMVLNNAGTAIQTPARPQRCEVKGEIAAVTAGAQPIAFQLNMPTDWNKKLMQLGGSGMNGSLQSALGQINLQMSPGTSAPLARRYMTAGTDSGHLTSASPLASSPDPARRALASFTFGVNDEMLRNFGFESYRKVYDVAHLVAERYYGTRPGRTYYFGGSEGGREALTMAQRFPQDYDGVFARAPVIAWTGLFSAFARTAQFQLANPGAYLSASDIAHMYRTVIDACDARDGIVDGVISDYMACQPYADSALDAKLCPGGYQEGICFTQLQLDGIKVVRTPTDLGFNLAHGVRQYPGWMYGGETTSWASEKTGSAPNSVLGANTASRSVIFGYGFVRYFISGDPNLDLVAGYNPTNHKDRIQYISNVMDSMNPDLSAFRDRGGKLLLIDCTGDYAKSAQNTFNYYDSVVATLGKANVESFVRLYVNPTAEHGCGNTITIAGIDGSGVTIDGAQTSAGTVGGMATNVDWVSMMEEWVESGVAPSPVSVIATRNEPLPPHNVTASKPLCHYPAYPKYTGTDATAFSSYTCVASGS
ncbi:tannase/feruloyl esterase family alpha/beta hydrolase [uncultured Hydrogenophaga sp.]|uniref:tannase/feruloyl esterase family alpha/beta hydrolase n=1 Tax=uncultured Hydrogenophaga sp. TaxID=199683 RepID=UPI0025886125|nr:tannase/feruloyl esterase family alpha/beta hydrolase [uncultured Hydrogenophaga sp.]